MMHNQRLSFHHPLPKQSCILGGMLQTVIVEIKQTASRPSLRWRLFFMSFVSEKEDIWWKNDGHVPNHGSKRRPYL